jgi:hypothetical protein
MLKTIRSFGRGNKKTLKPLRSIRSLPSTFSEQDIEQVTEQVTEKITEQTRLQTYTKLVHNDGLIYDQNHKIVDLMVLHGNLLREIWKSAYYLIQHKNRIDLLYDFFYNNKGHINTKETYLTLQNINYHDDRFSMDMNLYNYLRFRRVKRNIKGSKKNHRRILMKEVNNNYKRFEHIDTNRLSYLMCVFFNYYKQVSKRIKLNYPRNMVELEENTFLVINNKILRTDTHMHIVLYLWSEKYIDDMFPFKQVGYLKIRKDNHNDWSLHVNKKNLGVIDKEFIVKLESEHLQGFHFKWDSRLHSLISFSFSYLSPLK